MTLVTGIVVCQTYYNITVRSFHQKRIGMGIAVLYNYAAHTSHKRRRIFADELKTTVIVCIIDV